MRACVEKERGAREGAADSRELVVNAPRKKAERCARSATQWLYPGSSATSERAGTTVPILEVMWQIMDDSGKLKELLNRDKIVVRQDIWLDVTDGALSFGPNLNVGLGRLREAVGLNKPGKPFSFKMIEGQGPVRISVTQKVQDSGDVYNNVSKVMKQGE